MNNESAQPDEGTVSPGRPYDSAAIDRARLAAQEAAISPTSVPGAVSGAIIGKRYKLLEPIGEGGMGVVWMAEQRSPIRRIVAIKLIKAGMDSSAILARFSAERQALAMMDHPNIARIFDGGTSEQGHPFFVMELVKGLPLTRYCDERKMPLHERLDLFVQVCGAVQHAHQKGIIHRDLKPANLLVTEHDGKPIAKVIDFGLAKALGGSAVLTDRTLHTSFGAAAGTPQYMAPEQVAINALDIDTRADVYALGVILYELLAGSTPHDVSGLHQAAWDEIRRVIREVDPPRPSLRITQSKTLVNLAATRHIEPARLGKLIAGDLDWIVMKALEKDRHRRYGSVSDLAADLQRHLAGDPVLAAPPTVAYRLQKFTRKYKVALSTAATILMVLMAGVLLSTWQAIRARRAENFARRQTTEANNQKTEADRQKADAQRQRATADEANSKAVDEAKKVQRQLADSYVQNGISAWAEHDPSLAALWFAKALKIDQGDPHDPHRELMDRIRLGDSFRHCAWPTIVAQDEANRVRVKDDDITTLTMRKERDGTLTVVSPHGTRITLDSSVTRVTEAGNVLLAAKRGSVQLWDGVTGKALSPSLQAPGDSTSLIRLGRNHRFVTMSLNSDRGIWDTHTGEALSLNGVSVFDELIYSADRSLIAFKDGGRAQVWSIETLKQVGVSGDVPEQLYRMNEHGQVILYWDAFLRVWDPFSGTYAGPRFTTDYQYFDNLISVSPDGKRATLRKDASRLSLFDACTGTELCDFESFTFHDESPRFSNDGRWIYSRDLRWDTRLLSPPDPLIRKAHDTGGYFCLNGDGSMLASWGNDSGLRIWNIDKLQPVAPVASDLMEGQWNLRFMPGTDELIALSNDDDEQWHLAVCSLSNGRIVRSSARIKHAPRTYVSMRSVSPDGAYVLVTYHTQSLGDWTEGVFSTKNLNQVAVIAQGGSLPTLRFSPDGRALIAVGFGGIGAWDVATGKNISSPPSGWRAFAAPGVLCPDGKSCLTSGDPSGTRAELRIRALENGEALTPPFATTNHIGLSEYDLSHSLGFNGAVVCTPLDDSIRLWDARSTIAVTSKLSCDSNTIAAGICSDGTSVL
ncbi:MAG TPA: WD40 repeat domain-containing serine/threonine protein kinase, partial [Tepidisphaeraceae bacterium]|nr:WD40 repeat domain-containing serine/threonine protein kinase [Tepidisphaeraceae bacterium]